MLDFRNTNTLWASVLVETLVHLGATTAVISPGSRSTPLTVAFASHPAIKAIPILDERSASFFALGYAKANGQAAILVCTSGTAGANYLPAIIEAFESQIPLLVLTADRPPELRDCASGQTIDQQKLFGDYVRHYVDLALPQADVKQLQYLRQVTAQAWYESCFPIAGPVHINCPFRDPLAPVIESSLQTIPPKLETSFFQHLAQTRSESETFGSPIALPTALGKTNRGLIIVGPTQPHNPLAFCKAIATLSQSLGWPVITDGLSPLRNWTSLNPHLITTYDLLLRHSHHAAALKPEQVIQIGALPTSKILRQWLEQSNPLRWIIDSTGRNRDPLHGAAIPLPISLEALAAAMSKTPQASRDYCKDWCTRDAIAQQRLTHHMQPLSDLREPKLSWLLPRLLPPETALMVANSMPVRDVEWFWPLNDSGIRPYCSRGANGIDGTLSTALGIAHHHQQAVLLTGDLALLHDSNGFLNATTRNQHLTILLVNNQGGGIFERLPIAEFEPPFETFFAMPQAVDFSLLAAAHGIAYQPIYTWEALQAALTALPKKGVRLLELKSDRKQDHQYRQLLLETVGQFDMSAEGV
ncbi:MAG: 2-succinyl-5-enolpyruvyl-6-hydroxy-3-cyclohexene-1-carboxylic-acid synthase [Cyanobacteria bacterium J06638_28]